ncbi:rod shape-determining protein MreD [Gimesia fumaroli]|uniref:Uncharacterized protein n=1 Tax=Gimesia fumaroli TaxID=2527976 RepID=A0A518I6F7_9PLAN|nr:rod shape-determining protein MreD [Gimesia fumaroli]QDV48691.1 hypothetical protein Enr17x_07040 [Gimesia fumaroli]
MKFFSLLIFGYLMLIVQISFVPSATIAGSHPNLLLLVLCFALFWYRDARGFVWAIVTGLICETFDAAIPGTGILLLTGLIWLAYRIQIHFQIRSLFSRFVLMAVFAFTFDSLFQILNHLETNVLPELTTLIQQAAGNALYTAVAGLTLLISFKLVLRLVPFDFEQNLHQGTGYESRYSH